MVGEIVTTVLPLTGELGLVGMNQQDKTIRFEKKLPLLLLAVICFSIFLRPMVLSTNTYWTIAPDFFFRATDAGGNIDFGVQATSTGWFWSGSLIYFQNVFVTGSSYTWSELGFACTSNADMSIIQTSKKQIHYTVDGAWGVTSTTQVSLPAGSRVIKVKGANNWSESANIVTVSVTHFSSRDVVIYLEKFGTLRSMWGDLFLLIIFCGVMGLATRTPMGDGSNFFRTVLALVTGTAVLFIVLAVVENLG